MHFFFTAKTTTKRKQHFNRIEKKKLTKRHFCTGNEGERQLEKKKQKCKEKDLNNTQHSI